MCPHVAFSTRDPTCEQLLTAGGAGAGLSQCCIGGHHHHRSLSLVPGDVAVSTHCPPCKQLLAAVGVGALLVALRCSC
jgi:hypothetical protein